MELFWNYGNGYLEFNEYNIIRMGPCVVEGIALNTR